MSHPEVRAVAEARCREVLAGFDVAEGAFDSLYAAGAPAVEASRSGCIAVATRPVT